MFGRKRPYRRIYGVIGSCLCCVLWGILTVWFGLTDRQILIPLGATVAFGLCAWAEVKNYRKYGNTGTSAKAPEAPAKEETMEQ